MAARQTKTPGATEAPKATETEVVTPTTAASADANLDAILGAAETSENTSAAEATSTVSEPVTTEPTNAELLEIINGLKSQIVSQSTAPVAQHVGTSDATTPKRTRQVLGEKGWTTEEY